MVEVKMASDQQDIYDMAASLWGVPRPEAKRHLYEILYGIKDARMPRPAQQFWVTRLSIMMQSVLMASVRAPDGIRKDHPVKVLMRWYRRSILLSAFDGKALNDPFAEGGGSFTGPFTLHHAHEFRLDEGIWADASIGGYTDEDLWLMFDRSRDMYLRYVDELPHHFQLHLMHSAQIIGVYHPDERIREWWWTFYRMIVNDAHLNIESVEQLEARLSDNEDEWRKREWTPAK